MAIEPTGRRILVANVSRVSNIVIPNIFTSLNVLNDSEHIALNKRSGHRVIKHDLPRCNLKRSHKNAIVTSMIDTVEVNAAINSSAKKSIDHNCVPGRQANTSGSVWNTNVAPTSEWSVSPKLATAGNITKPISTATTRLIRATIMEVNVSLVLAG